ncbi:MAG: hypothetical protein GX366_01950 [Epulopiscium sp.]|nr:hypothetical protein [Candidatus Epulonipiscium sp.]
MTNKTTIDRVSSFLTSKSKVLILHGPTSSGKTTSIPYIRQLGFDNNFSKVEVFIYSNRLRNNMLRQNPDFHYIKSIYAAIFDFQDEKVNSDIKRFIPLKEIRQDDRGKKNLYIIDDSQLFNNSYKDTNLVRFGTGYLLDDIFTYFNLENNPDSKVIFIGDKNKLSYGPESKCALNSSYLQGLLNNRKINSDICQIELEKSKVDSEIVRVCQQVSGSIERNKYNNLIISNKDDISLLSKNDYLDALKDSYLNPFNTKILAYSNKMAAETNSWIKNNLAQNGKEINAGDFIIFSANSNAYLRSKDNEEPKIKRISNGLYGAVTSVDYNSQLAAKVMLENGQEVELSFIPAHITLEDGDEVEVFVFENYLKSNSGEISDEELSAYRIILSRLEKQSVASAVNDRYFKVRNAVIIKYAWCMTVNSAMANVFDKVYLNTDMEGLDRNNPHYYKWLYTGISTARKSMNLLNWKAITPYYKTKFNPVSNYHPIGNDKEISSEDSIMKEEFDYLKDILKENSIITSSQKSYHFHTIFEFIKSEKRLLLKFGFSSEGFVDYIDVLEGDLSLFTEIKKIIENIG